MVHRLVRHENPEGRPTPLLLLASLRELDPLIELVYFGERDWRLGAVRPTDIRYQAAQAILAQQHRLGVNANPKSVMLGRLLEQGFAQIAMYRDFGDPAGEVEDVELKERCTILANFTRRHQNASDRREAVFADALAESGGQSRRAKAEYDYHDALNDKRGHIAREMRGKTTFGYGGMTGGRGKLVDQTGAPYPFEEDPSPILTGAQVRDALEEYTALLHDSL